MAPIAASLAAGLNALLPSKIAAVPVVAGLVVGTAAGASFISTSPTEVAALTAPAAISSSIVAPANAAPAVAAPILMPRTCDMQTWPYIEGRCVAGAQTDKQIRQVSLPRSGETAQHVKSPVPLVTSDTVLRAPQNIDAIPTAKAEPAKSEKRKETRRKPDRRYAAQTYQVPSETRRNSGAVIVVRPMRLEAFR